MTYSNRPYASPYQHGSEFGVSNDAVAINKINTFVMNDAGELNLPGTWSDPSPFAAKSKSAKKADDDAGLDKEYISPICEAHIGAGVRFCDKTPPNCPMSRPLEPQRDINPGMWTYYKKAKTAVQGCSKNKILLLIIFLILLIMFLNA